MLLLVCQLVHVCINFYWCQYVLNTARIGCYTVPCRLSASVLKYHLVSFFCRFYGSIRFEKIEVKAVAID